MACVAYGGVCFVGVRVGMCGGIVGGVVVVVGGGDSCC